MPCFRASSHMARDRTVNTNFSTDVWFRFALNTVQSGRSGCLCERRLANKVIFIFVDKPAQAHVIWRCGVVEVRTRVQNTGLNASNVHRVQAEDVQPEVPADCT